MPGTEAAGPAGAVAGELSAAAAGGIALRLGPPSHEFLANPFISVHRDGVSPRGRLSGWMIDLSTPGHPVSVLVSVDGTLLGSMLGDRPGPEFSAVTAAAMLVRTEAFHAVGGFDERHLTVAFNDVDLCLKVRAAGWRVVWTPEFLAEHRESISRGRDDHPAKESRVFGEVQLMLERWDGTLDCDPFFNRWLSQEGTPFHDLAGPDGK